MIPDIQMHYNFININVMERMVNVTVMDIEVIVTNQMQMQKVVN